MEQAYSAVHGGGLWLDQLETEVSPWLRHAWALARHCRQLARQNCEKLTSSEYGCLLWLSSVRRSEFKSTATTAAEKRTMRVLPIALALSAQALVGHG